VIGYDHPYSHYDFWNSIHGIQLKPGAVGENLTLAGWMRARFAWATSTWPVPPGCRSAHLEARVIQSGDLFRLERRLNPGLTVLDLNRGYYQGFDYDLAGRYIQSQGLMDFWNARLQEKGGRPQAESDPGQALLSRKTEIQETT
jgi:MOSC domain-containing protein YiiM